MASVHAAHARRGDRVTSWWRGTSLRAKVTGVTVAVLAVGLLAAGLGTGVFGSLDEIASLRRVDRVFEPAMSADERQGRLAGWRDAVDRVLTERR